MTALKIDEYGQILLPLEVGKQLDLQNNDWLKVNIQNNQIVMTPLREPDADLVEELIDQGIFY